ncbi:hypothetical protein ACHAWF_004012, partial [Thalassiosira exigua]
LAYLKYVGKWEQNPLTSSLNKKAEAAAKGNASPQTLPEKKLEVALGQLKLAGGREEEPESDDDEEEDDPGKYLNELLAVADNARYDLGQCSKQRAMVKSGEDHYPRMAHDMAQQNTMMTGHPAYIRNDLEEVETVMTAKGMAVERFGMGMGGGFGFGY